MSYQKSVTFTQARQLIADWSVEHGHQTETIAIEQAIGRVAAEDVVAEEGFPRTDCCAVDGYAVAFSVLKQADSGVLQFNPTLEELNDCAVCYGQILPNFADTVIAFDQLTGEEGGVLTLTSELRKGDNVCHQYSDLKPNQKILKSNERITAQHLGLLASADCSKLEVRKIPKVVLLIVVSEQDLQTSNQELDFNLEMLKALLNNMGCRVVLAKKVGNGIKRLQAVFDKLREKDIDLMLVTGLVTSGKNNQMLDWLGDKGQIAFHQVRVKPGSALFFGRLGKALLFGLPKAPIAAFSSVCQFVWPAIKKTSGESDDDLLWRGKITHDFEKKHFRREFVRAFFMQTVDGGLEVTKCDDRLKSLIDANCFMILDESDQSIRAGEVVRIQPFYQFTSRTV